MAAYMIVFAKVKARDAFLQGYAPAAAKLVEKFGGRYLIRAQGAEVLEGSLESGASVVISEWPDKHSILQFWDSTEYQETKKLRDGIADVEVTIVETLAAT
ncbi:MAG: hypothetical protein CL797_01615 [Chromatiales bacterium]|jgi:uncharacterized protein (DUF1330 family)|nr:hypothetical protein [Chromatiales bacterium]